MTGPQVAAALLFAATFLLLALGRLGRFPVPRGVAALAGGLVTAAVLVPAGAMDARLWLAVDWQVILLLAGLMVLAGLAEAAGLFAGIRRRLLRLPPGLALWVALALVAATSAALLNDAAVVVLVPFLLPAFRALGLPLAPAVILVAVAANVGSLLTPFGNPQNAVLAQAGDLGVADFVVAQGPLVLLGLGLLGIASWRLGRRALPLQSRAPAPATARGRPVLVGAILLFLTAAATSPATGIGLGTAAAVAALVAFAVVRPLLGSPASTAAWRALDLNVIALFLGLYLLTAGLPAWFPSERFPLAGLDSPASATVATVAFSNAVGNVPAILTYVALDPAWTAAHAMFLVAVSTAGGALLLTGSAASLLAADQARKSGVEVRFLPFLREAWPWTLPVLLVGAWWTWSWTP